LVCGSDTSTTVAPASFTHSMPWRHSASISGGVPSSRYSFGMPTRTPLRSPVSAASKSGTGASSDVESFGSKPDMDFSRIAQSRTSRAIGPAWSSDEAKATMPQREQRP
jgi:hypothetical protein